MAAVSVKGSIAWRAKITSAWKATTAPGLIQLSEPKSQTHVLQKNTASPSNARYKTINCYWNRTDKKTRHFYLVHIFACFKSRRMLYEIPTTIFRSTMLEQCCYNPKQSHNNVASLPICPCYSTPQFCSREWTWLHKNWIVSITRYFWSGNHSSSCTFGSRRPIARYK